MKTAQIIVWIVLAFIGGLGWGLWLNDRTAKPEALRPWSSPATSQSGPLTLTPPNLSRYGNMPPRVLWEEYTVTRQKVLQDDSQLATEFKALQGEIAMQHEKLNAAMIEADPKVAAIIAKLSSLRQQRAAPTTTPFNQPATTPALSQ